MKKYEVRQIKAKQEAVRPQVYALLAIMVVAFILMIVAVLTNRDGLQAKQPEQVVSATATNTKASNEAKKVSEGSVVVVDKGGSANFASYSTNQPVPPENPYLNK